MATRLYNNNIDPIIIMDNLLFRNIPTDYCLTAPRMNCVSWRTSLAWKKAGSTIALPWNAITWAIEKVPHDDAESFCIAGAADGLRSGDGGKVLVGSSSPKRRHAYFGSGLISERRADTCLCGRGGVVGAAAMSSISNTTLLSREPSHD